MNYKKIFDQIKPGFFEREIIKSLPEDHILAELVMDLRTSDCSKIKLQYPKEITFGIYEGDLTKLHEAIKKVNEEWIQYFNNDDRIFCAFDKDKIAGFCILEEFGKADGLSIGGPGCVGTVPEYRRQGIGLEMVRQATEIIKQEGYDLSWIHWTHLAHWYSKLGYKTVIRWNCKGIVE